MRALGGQTLDTESIIDSTSSSSSESNIKQTESVSNTEGSKGTFFYDDQGNLRTVYKVLIGGTVILLISGLVYYYYHPTSGGGGSGGSSDGNTPVPTTETIPAPVAPRATRVPVKPVAPVIPVAVSAPLITTGVEEPTHVLDPVIKVSGATSRVSENEVLVNLPKTNVTP